LHLCSFCLSVLRSQTTSPTHTHTHTHTLSLSLSLSLSVSVCQVLNEEVASTLYHEYQHARAPYSYRNRSWTEEEERVYTLQTQWEIDRGMTTDPSLTTTDPVTGETEVNPAGVTTHVETYPGLAATQPGEVIGKVGANRVRVQLPDGRRIVRNAAPGDSVPGRRVLTPPIHNVRASEWRVTP
jgi:hypothetical protein